MKNSIFTIILTASAVIAKAQSSEIYLKLWGVNSITYKNTRITPTNIETSTGIRFLKYNIGYSYITKKDIEYSIGYGYSVSKDITEINTVASTINTEKMSTKNSIYGQWQQLEIAIGKRYTINKFLIVASVKIPLEYTNKDSSTHSFLLVDTNNNILRNNYQISKNPNYLYTGIYINMGMYYKLSKKFMLGFDISTGVMLAKTWGEAYQKYESNNFITNIHSSSIDTYQVKSTFFAFPMTFNIGFKYSIAPKVKKN